MKFALAVVLLIKNVKNTVDSDSVSSISLLLHPGFNIDKVDYQNFPVFVSAIQAHHRESYCSFVTFLAHQTSVVTG